MSKNDVTKKQRESIEKATREFEKQQAEVKPFIKTKKMTVPSTGGKWQIDTAIQNENHFGCLELDAYGHELKEDKELEEQIRDISFETISEMLDNPDSYGLYPTTKAFERIDREVLNLIAQERRKAKIEVYEELKPPKEFEQFSRLTGGNPCAICGFDPIAFIGHIDNRIAELKEELEDE